ncbi:hypothetical protein [Phocaeicola plebeius]|uniref:hypothetical protein n=1 Tax=Phocaeicola plebeius TaxID=310297 RepID=UPI0026EC7BBB|nr:hypothetical protein [Phocaeicola plebeius]
MRTIVTILLMMLLVQTTKAQESIFETTAGEIVTKSKFIDPFRKKTYNNITPYILKQTTNESLQNGDSYTINCLKYRNWENDPGDIHIIQILHQGKEVLKLNKVDGWKYISEEPDGGITKTNFYYSIDLDKDTKVLIFVGIYIQSLPPYISMVVLKSGKATLVFNKRCYINEIKKQSNKIDFILRENTLEYVNSSTPVNQPILKTLTMENGRMYFK